MIGIQNKKYVRVAIQSVNHEIYTLSLTENSDDQLLNLNHEILRYTLVRSKFSIERIRVL